MASVVRLTIRDRYGRVESVSIPVLVPDEVSEDAAFQIATDAVERAARFYEDRLGGRKGL